MSGMPRLRRRKGTLRQMYEEYNRLKIVGMTLGMGQAYKVITVKVLKVRVVVLMTCICK